MNSTSKVRHFCPALWSFSTLSFALPFDCGNISSVPGVICTEGFSQMGWGFGKVALFLSVCAAFPAADTPTFEKTVALVLTRTCTPCHHQILASGGVNIAPFPEPASLTTSRDGWDSILRKIRSGDIPPKGIPRPAQPDA